MMHLITGVPGSGKTLFATTLIEKWLKEGRAVYADIEGLQIDGVLPAPKDWRETPHGSVVIYDEAQRTYPPEGNSGRSSREDIAGMETHRHSGHDLLFITQHPKLLHSHVRRLIGRHYHINRILGSQNAKIYQADQAINTDSKSALNACDSWVFSYPKSNFSKYKSATIHTHKAHVPKFLIFGLIGIALVLGLAAALFFTTSKDFFTGNVSVAADLPKDKPSMLASSSSSTLKPHSSDPEPPVVSGCIVSASRCLCYDPDGKPLQVEKGVCRSLASEPLAYNIYSSSGSDRPSDLAPAKVGAPATTEQGQGVMPDEPIATYVSMPNPSFIQTFGPPPGVYRTN